MLTYYLTLWSRVILQKDNSSLASQEILCILWDLKDHCHVYKSPPLVPTQTQMNPLSVSYIFLLRSDVILCCHLSVGLQSSLIFFFFLGLPTKTLYEFFSLVCYMSCPSHPPCFDPPNKNW